MQKSKIEWTDMSWNPIVGCSKIGEGCKNCYAEVMARWLKGMGKPQYQGIVDYYNNDVYKKGWTGKTCFVESALEAPMKVKKPQCIFVCSMGDLFHPSVLPEQIQRVWEVMESCPQHTFIVLTKRPERIEPVLFGPEGDYFMGGGDFHENIQIGVSVSTQKEWDTLVPILLKGADCYTKIVSIEPMLEAIDMRLNCGMGKNPNHFYRITGDFLGQIIVGGESGPGARPMNPDWVRSIRDQCQATGVPFFFKQWGEWLSESQLQWASGKVYGRTNANARIIDLGIGKEEVYRVGKKNAGRILDGRTWDEMPK